MTLATEFARTTKRAVNPEQVKESTIFLYRRFMRYSREFCNLYELDMPVANVKTKIRQEFERHRYVTDIGVTNHLLLKGQMEFQELVNFWKQQCHVLRYFEHQTTYDTVDKTDFVKNFLRGAD